MTAGAAARPQGAPSVTTKPPSGLAHRIDRLLLPLYTLGVVSYLALPVLVMILFSFNDPTGRANLNFRHFSIDAWLDRFRMQWEVRLDALETEIARGKRQRRLDAQAGVSATSRKPRQTRSA